MTSEEAQVGQRVRVRLKPGVLPVFHGALGYIVQLLRFSNGALVRLDHARTWEGRTARVWPADYGVLELVRCCRRREVR